MRKQDELTNPNSCMSRAMDDEWTVVSADGSLTAHFEHTVAVTEGEPEILTPIPGLDE